MQKILLLPFALLYGLLLRIRHFLFDIGILPSRKFDIPIIGVGNLTLGGTGKTPHTEYLTRLLYKEYKLAILSRGYLRQSKGFLLADENSTFQEIGDEPLQYKNKFGDQIMVAVDKNRSRGVKKLLKTKQPPEVIVLDDALQHRFIRPGLNLLLTDYHRLYPDDLLVPAGKLRDIKSAAKRADIIIVTKTDRVLSPIVKRQIIEKINPLPHQKIYFSYLKYQSPVKISTFEEMPFDKKKYSAIILISGIANSYPLKDYVRHFCNELISIDFPDHHQYKEKDFELILQKWNEQFTKNKILVTTEKDAMRLINSPYLRLLKNLPFVYLPIEVKFHGQDEKLFNDQILNYVRENQRNRQVHSIENKR